MAQRLLFEGNVLAYDPTSNGTGWIPAWGTVNDLSPVEDSSARELSNITLPDSPKDIPQMDQFGECCRGPVSETPAVAFHTGLALHDEEEVMEQKLPEVEREGHEHTVEVESLVSNPQSSTDSDRQTEEEDETGLSDESTGKPADGPVDGTAVGLIEGHPSDDELAKGHPSNDELAEGHPSDDELTGGHPPYDELMETIMVECPTLGQELPLQAPARRTG